MLRSIVFDGFTVWAVMIYAIRSRAIPMALIRFPRAISLWRTVISAPAMTTSPLGGSNGVVENISVYITTL